MNKTNIEWTNYTWNPYTGCKNTCEFCYARKFAEGRLKGRFGYENGFEPTFHPTRLREPYAVKNPSKIFVASMGDLFGDWMLPGKGDQGISWIKLILQVVDDNPRHIFQFLTKYPQNLRTLLDYQRPNMWVGTSVVTWNDFWRIHYLRKNTSGIRFVSFEPLHSEMRELDLSGIDWIIIGAETGNRKGRIEPRTEWIEDILYNSTINMNAPPKTFMKDNLKPYWNGVWIQEFPE